MTVVARPKFTWWLCELVTGRILTELPLPTTETISRRVATVSGATMALPVYDKRTPPDWAAVVAQGRTMIVLTINKRPVNAWVLLDRTFGGTTVPLAVSTLEECLNRANVPEFDPYGMDYSDVAAALVSEMPARFGFVVDSKRCGKTFTGTQTYSTLEDRKVLAALNEDVYTADGGPEWRTIVRWTDESMSGFTKAIEIAPKIGTDRPDAVFDLKANGRGTIESYERTESFAEGKGATMVIGTSEGSGSSRPMTDPMLSPLVAQGFPVWEERVNFTGLDADDIADPDAELNSRAAATLTTRSQGSTVWKVTARDYGPRPGIDYDEGDTVRIDVEPRVPQDPTGGKASPRTLGWELDPVSLQSTALLRDFGEDDGG